MTPEAGRVGAIVLAGGRSSRYGSDKLAARIDGRTLLELAIAAVRTVATDIVVCTSPGGAPTVPSDVVVAHDGTPFDGPLAGVATGLAALPDEVDRIVVVAGDMPSMATAVLRRLLTIVDDGAESACLADPDGLARPLPSAYRRAAAAATAGQLLASGERRLRALPEALAATVVPEPAWRALDPDGGTLRDIDTTADLGLRAAMLGQVAETILGTAPGGRALVGIDGVDGAGKSTFADELAAFVRDHRPVVRATIDRFHHPAAARYARGRSSAEGFYLDSFDLEALTTRLLDPFRRGDAVVTGAFDHRRDEPDLADPITPASDAVLLFDGIFLHRPELIERWDLSIYLDVRPEVSVARLAVRDGSDPDPLAASNARYVEGQRLYLQAVDPAGRADIVVEQDDLWRPRLRIRPRH